MELNEAKEIVLGTLVNKSAWKHRAERLVNFAENNNLNKDEIGIIENNSWSRPPASIKNVPHTLIGGTTYKYMVWAFKKEI